MDSALGKKLDNLKRASERVQLITAHNALVVLRAVHQSSCTSCVHHNVLVTHYCLTSIIAFVLLYVTLQRLTSKTNKVFGVSCPLHRQHSFHR